MINNWLSTPEKANSLTWDGRNWEPAWFTKWFTLAQECMVFITMMYPGVVGESLFKKQLPKLGVVVHACNRSCWEPEAGGLWIWGQPELKKKFEAKLGYKVRPYLQNKTKIRKKNPITSISPVPFYIPKPYPPQPWQSSSFPRQWNSGFGLVASQYSQGLDWNTEKSSLNVIKQS
jgi:hypothetical protein